MTIAPAFNRWLRWESIDGDGACEPYMYRLTLLKLPGGRRLYLHHFVGDDWSRDPHDHPKTFVSIGLLGSYVEDVFYPCGSGIGFKLSKISVVWNAPWFRRFPARHIHRIRARETGGAWTLVYTGPITRDWGFWFKHRFWIEFREYLDSIGASRKDC